MVSVNEHNVQEHRKKLVINGLGRKVYLLPTKHDDNNEIIAYDKDLCYF